MVEQAEAVAAVGCGQTAAVDVVEHIDADEVQPTVVLVDVQQLPADTQLQHLAAHALVGTQVVEATDTYLMGDRGIVLPIIVDAGIGAPSQACEAMEMGAAAVMANTAVATAGDINLMAKAFGMAVEAGRLAYLSGTGRVLTDMGEASSPLTGFLRD